MLRTSSSPTRTAIRSSFSDLKGQTVVLYFYPRADTPGCTTQACGARDHSGDYGRVGVRVIGVSPDEVGAVKKFAEKFELDPDGKIAKVFPKVSPKTHDDVVLKALAELS